MQRGIDSYFKKAAPTPAKTAKEEKTLKRRIIISSDEEDNAAASTTTDAKSKRTRPNDEKVSPRTSSGQAAKKPTLSKLKSGSGSSTHKELKRVDPALLFGGETMRVESQKAPKPKDKLLMELDNDDMNESLLEIAESNEHKSKEKSSKRAKPASTSREEEESEKKSPAKKPTMAKLEIPVEETPPPKPKQKAKHAATPKEKNGVNSDLETSVISDEERYERRRIAAQAYQHYKNRPSCLNAGSKEVPKGKPNCFNGLTFLVSGILESLTRDEVTSIVKEYGGKMMTTAGKRLNYLIAGEDAGYKKMEQAKEHGTLIISEDDFLELIRTKSGHSKPVSPQSSSKKTSPEKKTKKDSPETSTSKSNDSKHEIKKVKEEMKKVSPKKESNNNNEVKVKVEPKEEQPKAEVDEAILAWVDKYKPTSVKDIIGQQSASSNVSKLINWLSRWYTNHDGKKKLIKPSPWAKNDDGGYFKAALLSGPPGIGKTTTATLVCKELGFDTVEFNASDTRSKRLLKEEVAELLSNKSLYGYFNGQAQAVTKKHVLIMDEVDGMAGNEDRGGIQELISLIKDSSVPIICMCNDRNHQKMRSLVNYCYDLRFNKPRMEQIKGRILSICFKEKFKVNPSKIEEIITATNNDIRQSINHISLLSAGKELTLKSSQPGGVDEKTAQKDLKIGPWEVVRKVFTVEEHKNMTFQDKCDLFFHDYSMAPLFVQQNYLQVTPVGERSEILRKVARTANALSLSDLVDKRIRTNSSWSLLPVQGVFSSVMPGEYMCGHFTGQINFPAWLGKYSRANKRNRLAQEIYDHTRIRTSGSRQSVRQDYIPFLLEKITRPLIEKGMEGIEESLDVIKEYHLLREDIDSLIELSSWPGRKSPFDSVDGRVKAALTRLYNKEVLAYSYSAAAGVKKKRAEARDETELFDGDGEDGDDTNALNSDDEKEDDDLENDGLIKAKKKSSAAAKATTSKTKATGKASTSKQSKASSTKAKK